MKKKKNIFGWIFLLLFCIPFAGVGTATGYSFISCIVKWQTMKTWQEVPAFITQTNLDVNSDSDSTTYKVTAAYSYAYNDKSYTGNKVTMHSGSDNIGSFQKNTYAELSRYKESGEAFRCYINPSNPSESILFRTPRLENLGFYLIFMLAFGGFGYGLFFAALLGIGKTRKEDQLKSQYQNEPWLWKTPWKEGIIHSQSKTKLAGSIIFALFWNLVSSPILFIIPGELHKGNKLVLIALIFPIVGLGLAIWVIRNIIAWRKFGDSTFVMETRPGVIGGPLKGKIHTKVNIKPEDGFHITLSCINRVRSGSGKNRSTREHIRWQDECNIKRELYEYDPSRSVIPVLFQIPYDSPETNDDNSDSKILWRLEIKAKVPGVDYAASFEVPVFKTPESSDVFVLDRSSIASYQAPFNLQAALIAEGIRVELLPGGGKRYAFPCARNKVAAFSLFMFTLIWTGVVVLLFKLKAPVFFPIIFGFFDILLILGFLDILLFQSQVEITNRNLSIAKGLFKLSKKQVLDFSDIESFKIKRGMTYGNKLFYNLNVISKSGKKHLIAKNLTSRSIAEKLAEEMEKAIIA
ncbi:MAG: DUF3592 domain-containing protein [Sedimentisphaerales bacterium]|nr:DUF3592 domain-containing protein [Sedimentisphaerales bacterium]